MAFFHYPDVVNCRFHLFDSPQHHLINEVFFIIQMLSIVVFICLIRRNITFLMACFSTVTVFTAFRIFGPCSIVSIQYQEQVGGMH